MVRRSFVIVVVFIFVLVFGLYTFHSGFGADSLKKYLESKGWTGEYSSFKPMLRDGKLSDNEKKLINYYNKLSEELRQDPNVVQLLSDIISDGEVTREELNLFDDRFINPTKPMIINLKYTPVNETLDKIYSVKITFEAKDDKTPISFVEVKWIPIEYKYFITKYGMSQEDYSKVFPQEKQRDYVLKPTDRNFDQLDEKFSLQIDNIVGGREYKIEITVKDEASNSRTMELKTPYIRQFENLAKKDKILVRAYYYPWYSPSTHWKEGYMGSPILGEYDSRDEIVISKHIDWATGHGIDFFIMSWWGPNSFEDEILKNYILKNPLIKDVKFAILYESLGRLKAGETNQTIGINLSDERNKLTLNISPTLISATPLILRLKTDPWSCFI